MLRPAAPARALRGGVVAVVGLTLAVAGHAQGGGTVRPTPLAVLVALLVVAACVLVSSTRWTTARLVVALLGTQATVHAVLWFETGAREVDSRLAGLADAAPGHDHLGAGASSTSAMLVSHVVAAVLAALLLAALEGALWIVVALARRILHPVGAAPVPCLPRTSAVGGRDAASVVAVLGAVGRRGPPAVLAPA
jgi:hypothetical protein